MKPNSLIYIAGHNGMVGSALTDLMKERGYRNLVTRSHDELNLIDQSAVDDFFRRERPEYVILLAARVGGIQANIEHPAEFLYENLMIESNVIHSAYRYGVKKLLFPGSSCIYPRECPQPMKEDYLLTGKLEPTNEGYAIAKIAGLKLCHYYNRQYGTNFIGLMPCNLYGPGDNFDLRYSHVLAALIRKFHEAKINGSPYVEVWGTGEVRREFLFVEDMADAILTFMETKNASEIGEFVNIGTGEDVSIRELAEMICELVGYDGEIRYDPSKPEGMPRKVLDVTRAHNLGWRHKTSLREGVVKTYEWFVQNYKSARK